MKNFIETLEQWMGMSDAVWERHAHPASGWSRMPILPAMALGIWGRVWLGWWSLLPIALVFVWIWLNPRVFPIPASTDNWMSKGVLGERVWLNRKQIPVPNHHIKIANWLNLLTGVGLIPMIIGLIQLNFWMTLAGLAVTMIAKLWFLDRMVWLFDDMKDHHEEYLKWLR